MNIQDPQLSGHLFLIFVSGSFLTFRESRTLKRVLQSKLRNQPPFSQQPLGLNAPFLTQPGSMGTMAFADSLIRRSWNQHQCPLHGSSQLGTQSKQARFHAQ